ncbi:MAG: lipoprotein insertase outer membrane protein LolB [Pseudomonadota bacterium]
MGASQGVELCDFAPVRCSVAPVRNPCRRSRTPHSPRRRMLLSLGGWVVATAGGLHGCATTPSLPQGVTPEVARYEQLERLRDLDAWSLQGRVALSTEADSFNGSIFWEQVDDDLDLRFRAPLGLGGFRVSGDDEIVEVEMSSGDSFIAEDPAPEFERAFGWSLPVHSLRYWMLGLPDPATPDYRELLDARGQPSRLSQGGWTVEYERFQRIDDSYLPTKLRITGRGVRIRLAVDRWNLEPVVAATAL